MALTDEQNKYVLELRTLSHKSPSAAIKLFADKFGFEPSRTTIIRKWGGYKSQNHGGHRFGFSEDSFRELYERHDGDIGDMREESKGSISNLLKWCKRCELEPRNVPTRNYTRYASTNKFNLYTLDDSV